jgi:hypothetical protein
MPRNLLPSHVEVEFLNKTVLMSMQHLHDNVTRVFLRFKNGIWFFDIILEGKIFYEYYYEQDVNPQTAPLYRIIDRRKGGAGGESDSVRQPLKHKPGIVGLIQKCVKILNEVLIEDEFHSFAYISDWDSLVSS